MNSLKRFFLLMTALFSCLGLFLYAQDNQKDQLIQNLEKKLQSDFITKGHWYIDFAEAKKAAQEQGKLIFAYFSRSYAP